jgi:hypothetical protein
MGIEAGQGAWQEGQSVITHIVFFRPKPDLTDADRGSLITSMRHAVDGIPSIRRARIGRRLLLNRPGYEQMAEHFEYSAILDFDSESDLRAYLDHPSHADLAMRLFSSAEAVLAYDFNFVEPERVEDLLT